MDLLTPPPVPYVSAANTKRIINDITENSPNIILEYGTGCSTIYFLKNILKLNHSLTYVAIENYFGWQNTVVDAIKKSFHATITQCHLSVRPWSMRKIKKFLSSKGCCYMLLPSGMERLGDMKRRLRQGWTEGGYPGEYETRWLRKKISKRFFEFSNFLGTAPNMLLYRMWPGHRPKDSTFTAELGPVRFIYENRSVCGKDQFGESPYKSEYINAGLEHVRDLLLSSSTPVHAMILIDGGPRADILHAALDLEEEFPLLKINVWLFEANRLFYKEATERRPKGTYIPGDGRRISGDPVYNSIKGQQCVFWYGQYSISAQEQDLKEIWHYETPD